ncbi:Putative competence-damage inducible protein [Lacunisphaera limnophila]|uniref:CinA-like protein n=1 Tax=Lacunisphaera limnophila TaxID=1838286 RepID=A0A1D8ATF7_9BACT|nr:CinA family nicotinamide mononucleotide deamidase-related protein [Lacunisphaera limnophila]AOS44173.1 Putative competence-damage inducible protein [Lacunisphaera limnophila]
MAHIPAHSDPARQGAPTTSSRYELLTLGDELLLGLTANAHLTWIGAQLGRRGVQLQRNVTVTDEADAIAAQFRESWARADVVITTGGLGPTCDDRTREVLAAVLGQKLVFDPRTEEAIRARFAKFQRVPTANNLKQAYRFERGEVLPNANGTAPGLWVEQEGKLLIMLPGPPNELQPMFTEQVIPRLAARGKLSDQEAYIQIRSIGIGESALETMFECTFSRSPGLGIAFCAHQGQVDCRISSPDGRYGMEKLRAIASECAALLGDNLLCFGHDSIAQVVADQLKQQGRTLAVAEASTGGMLANAFADLCGACKFFQGGIVSTSNEAKMLMLECPECLLKQHGAVSPECAVAMASGVAEKLGADYGLAITGFSGPCTGGGENPLGSIYIGLHSPHGDWAKQLTYPGPRAAVKQRAINDAIDWLRREVLKETHRIAAPQVN